MKKITLTLSLVLMASLAFGQSKLTPELRMQLSQANRSANGCLLPTDDALAPTAGETMAWPLRRTMPVSGDLQVIIKTDAASTPDVAERLKALGVTVNGRIGNRITATVKQSLLLQVETIGGVESVGIGSPVTLATDVSRRESRAADILQPTGDVLPQAYTGKGVIMGVIDTGFDFQHPVFKDAEGRSRIKAVYNPFGGSGSEAYDAYGNLLPGTVYDTPEQIEQLTTDTYKQMHGTHTASTAAGTHHGDWGGMAPDADLVLCLFYPSDDAKDYDASLGSSWFLLNSLAYLQGYVKNSGQRAVISMSLNSHSGPHNGKGDVVDAIQTLTGEDNIAVVMATGNNAAVPLYAHKQLASDDDVMKTFIRTQNTNCQSITYGYSRQDTPLTLKLCVVDTVKMEVKYETEVYRSDAEDGMGQTVLLQSSDDRTMAKYFTGGIQFALMPHEDYQQTYLQLVVSGKLRSTKYGMMICIGGAEGTDIDLWEDYSVGYSSFGKEGVVNGDNTNSQSDWASATSCISVGAYTANLSQRKLAGTYDTSSYYTLGDWAYFSSFGTALNGEAAPTVCAPGVNVVAAANRYYYSASNISNAKDEMKWDGGVFDAISGTSMATPCVSGIVALCLEAMPEVTTAEIKEALASTAVQDDFTAASPEKFGHGKVDALAALQQLMNGSTGIRQNTTESVAAPVYYTLQGVRVAGKPLQRGIYLKGNKKVVVE